MSVVIVGGHDRMVRQYMDICKNHNCKAKVFTQMPGNFKSQIGKADLVVLFTSTVSHKMVHGAVQEAKSGCEYYQCDIPVVFTNNTFSSAAINLAKNTNVELWDQDTLYHYLKKSKILTKSLPLYYPLFTFITTAILSYYYLQHQDYLLIPLLINMFLFISIIVKILKDKKKTPIILKEPEYTIHDYHDTIQ